MQHEYSNYCYCENVTYIHFSTHDSQMYTQLNAKRTCESRLIIQHTQPA